MDVILDNQAKVATALNGMSSCGGELSRSAMKVYFVISKEKSSALVPHGEDMRVKVDAFLHICNGEDEMVDVNDVHKWGGFSVFNVEGSFVNEIFGGEGELMIL